MLNFRALASSSAGNCYHLSGGGSLSPLLIDAGITFADIQKGTGFKTSELAGALISHSHGDHTKGVRGLLEAGIDCYASAETWAAIKPPYRHCAHVLAPEHTIQIHGWRVKPFLAEHDAKGTLGFVIDSPNKDRLLYLTDSAFCRYTFPGLTHIAIEANYSEDLLREHALTGAIDKSRYARTRSATGHMSIETLEKMLTANDLRRVERIYLLHLSDANSDEASFKKRIERLTGVPVEVCAK